MNYQKEDNEPYHVLDETTPWYEWLSYCECCKSLDAPGQPHLGRFMRFREYLKHSGII